MEVTTEARSIANRDEPIPMLRNDNDGDKTPTVQTKGRLKSTKSSLWSESANNLQDKLFNKLLQQVLPDSVVTTNATEPSADKRSNVERPNFSLPTMSNNFRRLNARIGVVFVFQGRLIRLFSWKTPTHTLSFLAVYTFCCLNPGLLVVMPLVCLTLFIMTPAFLIRHPPPASNNPIDGHAIQGMPSAPAATVKPAPDLSKDFFRNMRDLQNSMEDFSVAHDKVVGLVAPLTNFADEGLSTTVFLFAALTASFMILACGLVPWRAVFLLFGWAAICSSHPWAVDLLSSPNLQAQLTQHQRNARDRLQHWVDSDVVLDEAPEVREVEIFELQHQKSGSEWESWVYSKSPYDALSPARISGDRPRGVRYFEDVLPPKGWKWLDKKWSLDQLSQEWVEERMITVVEIETEGDRWVYDLSASDTKLESGVASVAESKHRDGHTGSGLTGEWRRRRWVRQAQRKVAKIAKIKIESLT